MRIDAHTHDWLCHQDIKDTGKYIADCARAGIDGIVLIATPRGRGFSENCFEVAERFGDFVIPVLQAPMETAGPDDIHRMFDRGALGIKFISPAHPYSDERYLPLYQAVKEREGVAVFHTGYLLHTPDYDPIYASGMDNMRPAHIDAILRRVPHLKVMMAHFGSPFWDETWTVIRNHPTVYSDFSGGTAIRRSMFFWREMFAPNGELAEDVVSKVCFATDVGYFREGGIMDDRIPRYINFYDQLFDSVGAPAGLREQVNSGNVLKLFGQR
ncbi:MAG: amidohydrolase family protein [Lentisphaerae bacterium]|nr:amidohydrolase family protein [Lentisphaerota bacterium]